MNTYLVSARIWEHEGTVKTGFSYTLKANQQMDAIRECANLIPWIASGDTVTITVMPVKAGE